MGIYDTFMTLPQTRKIIQLASFGLFAGAPLAISLALDERQKNKRIQRLPQTSSGLFNQREKTAIPSQKSTAEVNSVSIARAHQ